MLIPGRVAIVMNLTLQFQSTICEVLRGCFRIFPWKLSFTSRCIQLSIHMTEFIMYSSG